MLALRPSVFVTLLLSASLAHAAEGERSKVLVVPLHAGVGIEAGVADLITDALCADIQSLYGYQILTSKDVQTLLGIDRQKQLLGCTENSQCLTEIAGALAAENVVHGSLGRIGESFVFNIQLINGRTGVVTRRHSARSKSNSAEVFLDGTRDAAKALFSPDAPAGGSEGEGGVELGHEHGGREHKLLFAQLRGNVGLPPSAVGQTTLFGSVMAGVQILAPLSVSAGVLITSPVGVVGRVAWAFNSGKRLRPVVGVEVPVVFTQPVSVGLAVSGGLQFDLFSWLSFGVDVPLTYFVTAPPGAQRLYIFGAANAAVRFL